MFAEEHSQLALATTSFSVVNLLTKKGFIKKIALGELGAARKLKLGDHYYRNPKERKFLEKKLGLFVLSPPSLPPRLEEETFSFITVSVGSASVFLVFFSRLGISVGTTSTNKPNSE